MKVMVFFEVGLENGKTVRGNWFTEIDGLTEDELLVVRARLKKLVAERTETSTVGECYLASVTKLDG